MVKRAAMVRNESGKSGLGGKVRKKRGSSGLWWQRRRSEQRGSYDAREKVDRCDKPRIGESGEGEAGIARKMDGTRPTQNCDLYL